MSREKEYQRAIKDYCRDCCGGSLSQAKACKFTDCRLWPMTDWHHERKTKKQLRTDGVQLWIKVIVH